jgi:uncharacterized membrane-anchored protein YitT (DUF2179 family)
MLRRCIRRIHWDLVFERVIAGLISGVGAGIVLLIGQLLFT